MKDWRGDHDRVRWLEVNFPEIGGVVPYISMGGHNSLGPAGGARCVHQMTQVAVLDIDRFELVFTLIEHGFIRVIFISSRLSKYDHRA